MGEGSTPRLLWRNTVKRRWLLIPLVAFAVNANADFCTPENGRAWYLLSGELARAAKICRADIYYEDSSEACRPFVEKHERTRKISSYVQECYASSRAGRNGLGYSSRRGAEVKDNMAAIATALEKLTEFQAARR
jgi:hypothetical protein